MLIILVRNLDLSLVQLRAFLTEWGKNKRAIVLLLCSNYWGITYLFISYEVHGNCIWPQCINCGIITVKFTVFLLPTS